MTGLRRSLSCLEASGIADEPCIAGLLSEQRDHVRRAVYEMSDTVRQEKASEVFLATLKSLIASQEVVLAKVFPVAGKESTFDFAESPPHGTIIGYVDDEFVYIEKGTALKKVKEARQREGSPLEFSAKAITSQLIADQVIEADETMRSGSRGVWQIYIRSSPQTIRPRVYMVKREVFER